METEKKGIFYTTLTYLIWGILPIYWKFLHHVGSEEILTARVIWSFVFTMIAVFAFRQFTLYRQELKQLWKNKRAFWSLVAASFLIAGNWYLYIWAVNHDHLVETSLGYYINPLVSVLLGILFLKEKLSNALKIAFVLAAVGVTLLTVSYGHFPWLAFSLAFSFGIYGLLKKTIKLDALRGLAIESMFVLPFAILYYIYLFVTDAASFGQVNVHTDVLLVLSGIATAVPLWLFAKGAQLIPLYLVGFLQYIAPTCMLFLGVIVYGEPFKATDLTAFSFIWAALITVALSKVMEIRKKRNLPST